MAYTWVDGEVITATKLNSMSSGGNFLVYETGTVGSKTNYNVTWQEFKDNIESGMIPVLKILGNDFYYYVPSIAQYALVQNNDYMAYVEMVIGDS